jgi:hypothetical protein
VFIDCAKKSVKLTTLNGKELELITEPVVCQGSCQSCEGEPTGC